jgi:hypothetical protein
MALKTRSIGQGSPSVQWSRTAKTERRQLWLRSRQWPTIAKRVAWVAICVGLFLAQMVVMFFLLAAISWIFWLVWF